MSIYTAIASADSPTGGIFDFPGLSLGSYRMLEIVLSGIRVTTDGTRIKVTYYVSSTEVTSGYRTLALSSNSDGGTENDGSTSTSGHFFQDANASWHVSNTSLASFSGILRVDGPLNTAHYKKSIQQSIYGLEGGAPVEAALAGGAGIMENAGAIDGLKISGDSSFTAGKARVLAVA